MMVFFIAMSSIGFVFAVLLWMKTRDRLGAQAPVPTSP
jgi:hypothetical protein